MGLGYIGDGKVRTVRSGFIIMKLMVSRFALQMTSDQVVWRFPQALQDDGGSF